MILIELLMSLLCSFFKHAVLYFIFSFFSFFPYPVLNMWTCTFLSFSLIFLTRCLEYLSFHSLFFSNTLSCISPFILSFFFQHVVLYISPFILSFFPTRCLVYLLSFSLFFSNTLYCISLLSFSLFFPTRCLVYLSFHSVFFFQHVVLYISPFILSLFFNTLSCKSLLSFSLSLFFQHVVLSISFPPVLLYFFFFLSFL